MSESYPEMVTRLAKSGEEIANEMTPIKWGILVSVIGQFIEAGATLDTAKKQTVYNKDMGLSASPLRNTPNLTAEQAHLLHMALGVAGEAAELLFAVATHLLNKAPLDEENAIEELGDLEFYLEGFRQGLDVSRDLTLEANQNKLSTGDKARYKDGYSDQAAQERADKVDETESTESAEVA